MQDAFRDGVKWGVLANAAQKLVSFGLNQALMRCIDISTLGMAAVPLELFLSSLTFVSREGVRLALLRESITSRAQLQRFVNLSWVPMAVLTVFMAALSTVVYFRQSSTNITTLMYCLAAVLEATGEPWVNLFQNNAQLVPKMQAEAAGLFVKSVVTFVTVGYLGWGVHGFGIAQISYGLTYLATLASYTSTIVIHHGGQVREQQQQHLDFAHLLPGRCLQLPEDDGSSWLDMRPISFAVTATGSCILKHILTEADKIFLSLFRSNYDQGIFAVANNYASLVVRIIFLPIEDASRIAFSQLSSGGTDKMDGLLVFVQLLRVVGLIGMLFPLFGTSYVHLAVRYLLNEKWQGIETEHTLKAFCVYIFILSINGISEAYCQILVSTAGFTNVNLGLVLSFVVYVVVSFLLIDYIGTSGVVLAGTAAMVVRIVSSHLIVKASVAATTSISIVNLLVPSVTQGVTVALASLLCYASSLRFAASAETTISALEHFLVGVAMALFLLAAHWRQFSEQIALLLAALKKKNKTKLQ